jgi:hypothetical protein
MSLGSVLVVLSMLFAAPVSAQTGALEQDPTKASRQDMGKMWTFENPPGDLFSYLYGFNADQAWFDKARLAALRIPGCSAAFVSSNGLVVTNHHCVRGAVDGVSQEGESLLDDGFYASTTDEERPLPNFYVDQLVAAEDVSEEVFQAVAQARTDAEREDARQRATARIEDSIAALHSGREGSVRVEVTALYNGGRYSAYTYRRYSDVRLVVAAELALGHFGGDPDNWTYPRYALDFAFLRVYGSDGEPLQTDHYFTWSLEGVEQGDVVFVIGNPGATNRLNTVAQLEFQRDVSVPAQKSFLGGRLGILREFYEASPTEGVAMGLRTQILSLSNSFKAYTGRLEALRDRFIMARKADGERHFQASLEEDPEYRVEWGSLIREVADLQAEKTAIASEYAAYLRLGSANTEAALLNRAFHAAQLIQARQLRVPEDRLEQIRAQALRFESHPRDLEEALLAERLRDFERHLGADHPVTEEALGGRSAEGAAANLLTQSVLATSEGAAAALDNESALLNDPAILMAQVLFLSWAEFASRFDALTARERELAAELGRARLAVYGSDVPPDGSRSPRITDGVVSPYEYNGTLAPVYTTFFGLYDHFYSYGTESDWHLPDRWIPPPPNLNLGTPLNFISTADTYGGNSGSPAVTPALSIVGLNFDRNIEGMSRDFIYLPERGRNIMVDVRAILEALDKVYDTDRIVQEILADRFRPTEDEADPAKR